MTGYLSVIGIKSHCNRSAISVKEVLNKFGTWVGSDISFHCNLMIHLYLLSDLPS
jgi:hypothetical protein